MKITLFGGSGKTGHILLEKALGQGHEIVAYVRSPNRIPLKHERLKVIQGELINAAAIDRAVSGADAVISLLGPKGKSPGLPVSKGMKNIVASMQKHGVSRLIATATPSAGDTADTSDFRFSLAVFMIKATMKTAYDDIVQTAEAIRKSNLNWTVVRLPMLTDKPQRAPVVTGYIGDKNLHLFWLNRSDLADFLLRQLNDITFSKKAPVISN